MPANPDLVRRAGLLGLDINNEGGREERTPKNKFHLLTREGARHPTSNEFFLQIILYILQVRQSGRVVRENDSFR